MITENEKQQERPVTDPVVDTLLKKILNGSGKHADRLLQYQRGLLSLTDQHEIIKDYLWPTREYDWTPYRRLDPRDLNHKHDSSNVAILGKTPLSLEDGMPQSAFINLLALEQAFAACQNSEYPHTATLMHQAMICGECDAIKRQVSVVFTVQVGDVVLSEEYIL